MEKIKSYSLCVLFFIVPIIYSGLYIPGFSSVFAEWIFRISGFVISGFEKVKVGFFFIPLSVALFAQLILIVQKKVSTPSKNWIFCGLIFLLWTGVSYFINSRINPFFWFGNPEKMHGWFLYAGLFILFWMMKTASKYERKKYLQVSLYSAGIVFLYAVFQKIGVDPLSKLYQSRLDASRVFSTLGNPNYLAGYALMILPLLKMQKSKDRMQNGGFLILFCLLIALVIYWTKSYLAWIIFPLYLLYFLVMNFVKNIRQRYWIFLYLVVGVFVAGFAVFYFFGSEILASQKMHGFIARWYLWQTGIAAVFGSLGNFLFGYGPDGLLPVAEHFRHPLLSVYEDPAFRIDRSHNVIIDLFVHFGAPVAVGLFVLLCRHFKNLPLSYRESLVLFLVYFSFNIPVLVHYLIIVLVLNSSRNLKN